MDPVMDGSARSSIRATQCRLGEPAPGSPAAAALTRRGRTKAYVVVEMCSARDPAPRRGPARRDGDRRGPDRRQSSLFCSVLEFGPVPTSPTPLLHESSMCVQIGGI